MQICQRLKTGETYNTIVHTEVEVQLQTIRVTTTEAAERVQSRPIDAHKYDKGKEKNRRNPKQGRCIF